MAVSAASWYATSGLVLPGASSMRQRPPGPGGAAWRRGLRAPPTRTGPPPRGGAEATGLGPGTVTPGMPRSRAAATSPAPGSLTAGVPASVTSATSVPLPSRCRMRRSAPSFECAWKLISSACEPTCASSGLVCRVSSAATALTRLSVAAARGDRSSRLPSGVATTYRVPAMSPRHLPRQPAVVAGRLQHVAVLPRRLAQDLGGGPRHHDFHAFEPLQRPVGQRARELLRLDDGIGRLGPARRRQQGDRLVRVQDPGAYLTRPAPGPAGV